MIINRIEIGWGSKGKDNFIIRNGLHYIKAISLDYLANSNLFYLHPGFSPIKAFPHF